MVAADVGCPGEISRHRAICDAALELVVEQGYDKMSMDAVASRARASKATIYRKWSGKRELVTEAMRLRGPVCVEPPDTGSLRGDLMSVLRQAATGMVAEETELMVGVLQALREAPEMAEFVRDEIMPTKRQVSRHLTEAAIARGELAPGTDPYLSFEIGASMIFFRTTVLGEPVDEAFLAHVADDVLIPLLTRETTLSAPVAGAPLKESA